MDVPVLLALLWSWLGAFAVLRNFLPPQFFDALEGYRSRFMRRWLVDLEYRVPERSGAGHNDLYKAVHHFISSRALTADADSLIVDCPKNTKKLLYEVAANREVAVTDEYKGVKMKWHRIQEDKGNNYYSQTDHFYELNVSKKYKELVPEYLDFVLEAGKKLESDQKFKKLHANLMYDEWSSVVFSSPATFETVALDPPVKKLLMDDLTKFLKGKEYYKKVGRAWKRGYLLYGPPGTGKSSLIGAIANFTGYDVYDLELTKVKSNVELKQLLIKVKNRSIIVVEDIDCSVQIHNRTGEEGQEHQPVNEKLEAEQKAKSEDGSLTLSGLLNVTDGLWSSCGSERIFIFTTNHVEKLDPALLRPGRMDMHICMSYCTYPVFRILARNYLTLEDHKLFPTVEKLFTKAEMTPAEVIETLLRYDSDVNVALEQLISAMKKNVAGGSFESQVLISFQTEDVDALGDPL